MAEHGTEKMTEWLDIKMDTLSSDERIRLIEEICASYRKIHFLAVLKSPWFQGERGG